MEWGFLSDSPQYKEAKAIEARYKHAGFDCFCSVHASQGGETYCLVVIEGNETAARERVSELAGKMAKSVSISGAKKIVRY